MRSRPMRFLIALIPFMVAAACDEQGSFGYVSRSQADERVDETRRYIDEVGHHRARTRRDSRRDRRGSRSRGRNNVSFLPHRGDYVIEVSGYSGTRFTKAQGTLTIDLIDDCDDWTLQEKLDVVLVDQAKKTHRSNLLYRATEKSSVDRFTFAYSRDHFGEREDYIGNARPTEGGFLVSFVEPKISDMILPADVLYPIGHLRQTLAGAGRQRGGFEAVVFDGGNAIPYRTVTEIGAPLRSNDDNPRVTTARKMLERSSSDRLPTGTTWPVTTSYFPLNDPYAAPIFVRDFLLHETGIIIGLHFDYGDIQMDASLANLDISNPARCAQTTRR